MSSSKAELGPAGSSTGGADSRACRLLSCQRIDLVRPCAAHSGPSIPWCFRRNSLTRSGRLCRSEGLTPFMALLAAFELLLGRWSGQDDFTVGSPVANRTRAETERVLGYFVNMLAFRADLSGNPTVREFLGRVREVSLEAFENQEIPLEVLIPALKPDRDASRSPLFQVMFILQNNALPEVGSLDVVISPLDLDQGNGTAKFDLALGFEDNRDGFAGSLEFNTDLFEATTIARFAEQYVKVLEGLVLNPDRRLSEISLLCERERQQVVAWSRPRLNESEFLDQRDRLASSGIHGRFETQAEATPDRVSLVSDFERLTYAELNARASQLARHLRSKGARSRRAGRPRPRLADQSNRGRSRRAQGGGGIRAHRPVTAVDAKGGNARRCECIHRDRGRRWA